MAAAIEPRTVERVVYGQGPGRVLSVSSLPATPAGMRRTLRNGTLVQELLASGSVVEVRIALDRDPSTPTGFAWKSIANRSTANSIDIEFLPSKSDHKAGES